MSATEWKFVPVEPTIEMVAALGFDGDVEVTIGHGAISAEIVAAYTAMLDVAPVPPSVESLLENWTPSDQKAFAKFRDEHFPGEMSSYAIQSLGSAWKDGRANASPEVPQYTGTGSDSLDCILGVGGFASFGPLDAQPAAAHLTIPGALEWDGDNGTHGADGESRGHGESDIQPVPFIVGNYYRTQAGALVRFVKAHNEGTSYESMEDESGVNRYTLRDFGRVTGTCHAYSDPRNTPPLYARAEIDQLRAQLANTEQSRRSFFDLSQDLEKRLAERDALLAKCKNWIESAREGVLYPIANEFQGVIGHNAEGLGQLSVALLESLSAIANPAKPKTCIECDQPYCPGVCVERGDQDYDRDQAAKGGDDE